MTRLITFSWHFLLILAAERARRVNWGVTPHPAKVGLGVRKCPQAYLVDNIEPRKQENKIMVNESDATRAYSAEVHILFSGYAQDSETPAVSRVASTIGFVRDGAIKVIIDPGMLPDQSAMLAPLAALGESPTSITDVVFSHHHPDHTLNAALFPNARFHDYWCKCDTWMS
jgi:hypothetical protein